MKIIINQKEEKNRFLLFYREFKLIKLLLNVIINIGMGLSKNLNFMFIYKEMTR